MLRRPPRSLAALVLVAVLAGCGGAGSGAAGSGRLEVLAAFYPYEFLARAVGGDAVDVTGLTKPGAEPHDLELSPRQVGAISTADLVVYARSFQPAVDQAVSAEAVRTGFDVNAVAPLEQGYVPLEDGEAAQDRLGADPHVWLDPTRYAAIATALAERLAAARPEAAAGFRERASALGRQLTALDGEFRTGLADCARSEIVTSHNAFGYLARRYGLTQVAVTGLTPDAEPTSRRLADVAALARRNGATTIFFETLVSPRTAQSLAREIGAESAVLNPLESPPETGDFFSAMRADLVALRSALDCT